MTLFREVLDYHRELKHKIHSTRIPLSPNGRRFMGLVYFMVPVVGGCALMEFYVAKQSEAKWGVDISSTPLTPSENKDESNK